MVKKKNKKKVLIIGVAVGLILIFLAIQQLTFIDTRYDGIVSCDKETGCTGSDIKKCEMEADELSSIEGWDCGACKVYCSNTAEMQRRNLVYLDEKCDFYSGGGALVEVKAKCTLTAPKSHEKTVCSNGKNSIFASGSGYPQNKVYTNWDIYWMNEFDQLEEKKLDCKYACQQDTDFRASCIESSTDENKFIAQDHKGCYAFGGRNEVWYFDSDDKLNTRIEVCEGECDDGKCLKVESTTTPTTTTPTTTTLTVSDCYFGECSDEISLSCADGTVLIAYTCEDGCSVPTNEFCPDGERAVVSSCTMYQKAVVDGTCSFDITQFQYTEAWSSFYEDYRNTILITSGVTIILISLLVSGVILSKKRGGL